MKGVVKSVAKLAIADYEVVALLSKARAASFIATTLPVYEVATKSPLGVVDVRKRVTVRPADARCRRADRAGGINGLEETYPAVSDGEAAFCL
jgi:hypothetical protein